MFKTFRWNRALFLLLIVVMASIIWHNSSLVTAQTLPIPDSEMNMPVCFMQTGSGETLDLSKLCNHSEPLRMINSATIANLQKTRQCQGCTLQNTNLANVSLRGIALNRAHLSNANLANASLAFADLSGATLDKADLRGANLLGANLTGANLAGANLRGANLRGALLQGANLKGATMPDGRTHN